MQQFTIKINGFNEVRKKAIGVMVAIITVILLISVLIRYPNDESPNSVDTLPYVLTIVVVIFSFSAWNAKAKENL